MDLKEEIFLKINKASKEELDLLELYIYIWENGVLLKADIFTEVLAKTKEINHLSIYAPAWHKLSEGYFCSFFPNHGNGFEKLNEAIQIFRQVNDKAGEGAAQALLAIYFKTIGRLDKAQANVHDAINNIGNNRTYRYFLSISYYQAGEIHHLLNDHEGAIDYFTKGLNQSDINTSISARCLNGIGTVYADSNKFELAFEYFQKSLKQIEGKNNFLLESKNYADIGIYYFKTGDYDNSLSYQLKSLEIRKEKNLSNPLITNYIELSELFLKQKNYQEALNYILLAEKLAIELSIKFKLFTVYRILSIIYQKTGKTELALENYKKYNHIKDEVLNQENARKIKQMSMHYEMENMQKEKEIFTLRNVELKSALDEIEASVRYAKKIQEAVLPTEKYIERILNFRNNKKED